MAERSVSVDKDIKKSISATDKDAQYDEKAKNLLGHKIILAHILVKTIDEFKGMNPKGMNLRMPYSILKENHILAEFQ